LAHDPVEFAPTYNLYNNNKNEVGDDNTFSKFYNLVNRMNLG
jgi:hypothetical protein